jgi:hypothetical protein
MVAVVAASKSKTAAIPLYSQLLGKRRIAA